MIFVMFGAPASGKGTHSGKLSEALSIPCISTGDLLRAEEKKGSPLGKIAGSYMKEGILAPDWIVLSLVCARIAEQDCAAGFILDGFPRTVEQKEALDKMLTVMGDKKVTGVIQLDVSREELISRYQQRVNEDIAAGKTPRQDDNQQAFERRLEQYAQWTAPVLDAYRAHGVEIHPVNGNGQKHETAASVKKAAEKLGADFTTAMGRLRGQGSLVSKDPGIHLL